MEHAEFYTLGKRKAQDRSSVPELHLASQMESTDLYRPGSNASHCTRPIFPTQASLARGNLR